MAARGAAPGRTVEVALTDAGCEPAKLDLQAGPTTFKVTNKGTSKVSEFEVKQGDRILGEVENVTAGLERTFSLNLKQGSYVLACPGGTSAAEGTLTVGAGAASAGQAGAEVAAAPGRYRAYVQRQTAQLVARTREFVAAVSAGDVATAKQRYVPARIPYERIEPVAESFGDLDPTIDAREVDGDLAGRIQQRFDAVDRALVPYRQGTAGNYVSYQRLSDQDKRTLSQGIDALAEPLSQVSAKLAAAGG
jgi:iron uptake system EfeUOB component EfeO/EfeM